MSALVSRMILSGSLVTVSALWYYAMWYAAVDDTFQTLIPLVAGCVFGGVFLCMSWFGIWFKTVVWTSSRKLLTSLSVLWSVLASCLLMFLVIGLIFFEADLSAFFYLDGFELSMVFGSACAALCWIASTAIIWRETPLEYAQRAAGKSTNVKCLKCGYDMTGLREARCPECGTQFTLDQLCASVRQEQPNL